MYIELKGGFRLLLHYSYIHSRHTLFTRATFGEWYIAPSFHCQGETSCPERGQRDYTY